MGLLKFHNIITHFYQMELLLIKKYNITVNNIQKMKTNSIKLAKLKTKLSLQRTYLSYMRTGFAIAGIAGIFKKSYLIIFGLIMILLSTIQYYLLLKNIDTNELNLNLIHYFPLIYVILSIGVLYLQFYK